MPNPAFALHPTLKADTLVIGEFPLCLALLMNNALLPWVILVPKKANIQELYQLEPADQLRANAESLVVSEALMRKFNGDKLNLGALGNIVPQLHLHHIVRFESDPVWPKPVWGNLANHAYSETAAEQRLRTLRALFTDSGSDFSSAPDRQ